MTDVIIQVEGLSKQYRLGEVSTGTLSHDLNRWWHRIRGREDPYLKVTQTNIREKAEKLKSEKAEIEPEKGNDQKAKKLNENQGGSTKNNEHSKSKISAFQRFSISAFSSSDYVWALQDINFEVKRGEVLGIIGRNGAGKSTLLKILSRVTAPTTGEIRVKGRIASLLEVGTGFHPQLTGRENIYLNGAILGMTKPEIASKLDEIVEFSGCARYIDTPVKRYSSGMIVRLGFAVAAHLEPEILIVDEVLAVGDAEFQKKCIGKMQDVASHGRTVLFVSHNLNAVRSLCSHTVCLDYGKIVLQGNTDNVVDSYLAGIRGANRSVYVPEESCDNIRTGNSMIQLLGLRIAGEHDGERISNGHELFVEAIVRVNQTGKFSMCVPVYRAGEIAFLANSYHAKDSFEIQHRGTYLFTLSIPSHLLNPGDHELSIYITDGSGANEHYIKIEKALSFEVEDDGVRRGKQFHGRWPGAVSPILEMNVVKLQDSPEWIDCV